MLMVVYVCVSGWTRHGSRNHFTGINPHRCVSNLPKIFALSVADLLCYVCMCVYVCMYVCVYGCTWVISHAVQLLYATLRGMEENLAKLF